MGGFGTVRRLDEGRARAKAKVVATVVLSGVVALLAQSGCTKDDAAAGRTSRRGEVCQVASDCSEGLFCAPMPGGAGGGICVTGNFRVAKTAKSCTIVECVTASDCCDGALSAACPSLRAQCETDKRNGQPSSASCTQYASQCRCELGTTQCELGKCVSRCNGDQDCGFGGAGAHCAGGKCVQCTLDSDCGPGTQCASGTCEPFCTNDGACSGFDRCLAGRCIPSGCQADRECIAATRNVDARCGTDGKCIVPCETDLECGSPTSYSFFSCIDKQCTYVGCESDKDCRLFFTGPSDASTLPARQTAVCRDNGVGEIVKPSP